MEKHSDIAALIVIDAYIDRERRHPVCECPVVNKKAIDWACDAACSVGSVDLYKSTECSVDDLLEYETVICIRANTIIRRSNMKAAWSQHVGNTALDANGHIIAQIYSAEEFAKNRTNLFAGSDFTLYFDDCYFLNSAVDVLRVNELVRRSIINRYIAGGVIFTDLSGVVIGRDAVIAPGAVIQPGTVIVGDSVIGPECQIGPGCHLNNTIVGSGVKLLHVVADGATIGDGTTVGPYAYLRPGTVLGKHVKVGDFVEIKNSSVGDGTSVAHLTYIGDADVGSHCNFGCGTVVVNYDGEKKSRTTVGDYCFVGCNTNLVSPVKLGDGAFTAAGSTITKDVPENALAIERGEQRTVEGYSERKLKNYFIKHGRKSK